mmetsp:Transcript_19114/g.48450  ORF Transcript_19114/g.48450 Transcript_19114/m.48450 type:complete len:399 (+) Transcript_19114:59-1255(+)
MPLTFRPYRAAEIVVTAVACLSSCCCVWLLVHLRQTRVHSSGRRRLLVRQLQTLCVALVLAYTADVLGMLSVHFFQTEAACWTYKAVWRYFMSMVLLIEMHVAASLAATARRLVRVLEVLYAGLQWLWVVAVVVDLPFLILPSQWVDKPGWCEATDDRQRTLYIIESSVAFLCNMFFLGVVLLTDRYISTAAGKAQSFRSASRYLVVFVIVWLPYIVYYWFYDTGLGKQWWFVTLAETVQASCGLLIAIVYRRHLTMKAPVQASPGSGRRTFDFHVGFEQTSSTHAISLQQDVERARAEEETKVIEGSRIARMVLAQVMVSQSKRSRSPVSPQSPLSPCSAEGFLFALTEEVRSGTSSPTEWSQPSSPVRLVVSPRQSGAGQGSESTPDLYSHFVLER